MMRHESQSDRAVRAPELFLGDRTELRPLFAEADDSAAMIDAYIQLGEVLVARSAQRIAGHVQLLPGSVDWEIKSLAVSEDMRRRGVGAELVRAALRRAFSAGASRVLVATATADIGNLRFYQRLGFRMDRVERDAFGAGGGYPPMEADGIPIRDRVWFSIEEHSWAAWNERPGQP